MELIIAILISLGTITAEESKNFKADDMGRMEVMVKNKGVTDKMIENYKLDGIIFEEESDI